MLHSLNHYRNNHFIEKVHFITFMQVIGYNTSKIITDSFTENALTYKYTVRSTVSVCKPDWLLMKSHPLESTANKLRGHPSVCFIWIWLKEPFDRLNFTRFWWRGRWELWVWADIFLFDQVQNQGNFQKSQNVRMDGDLASNEAIRQFAWHFLN